MRPKYILVCSIKNEGIYILEWIAYHLEIGFDHIILCSNDNSDGSDLLLNLLDFHGVITHFKNEVKLGESPQLEAYKKVFESNILREGDFVCVIDIDEFIVLKAVSTIKELVSILPEFDCVALPWRHFGSSGQNELKKGLVIERFETCTKLNDPIDNQFKSMFLYSKEINSIGLHRPRYQKDFVPKFLYLDGVKVNESVIKGELPRKAGETVRGYQIAQLNHYSIKSYQEFLLKRIRGNGFRPNNVEHFNDSAFLSKDRNEVLDKSLSHQSNIVHQRIQSMLSISKEIENAQNIIESIVLDNLMKMSEI